MASTPTLTVLERCKISPPPATVVDRSLPLTFLDTFWLRFHPVHHLFFYDFPHPTTDFVQTVVPKLKRSLSVTLQHFFPFVGNLIIFPTPSRKPEIRYVDGDSVALTFAESSLYFNYLTENHTRDCDKFYPLIPLLGHATKLSDYVTVPVFSVQVTFFPNSGISIGTTNHHCLGDASTRFCFMKAWTSIARLGTDELFLANGPLPFYDRVIKYPNLDEVILSRQKVETLDEEYQHPSLGPTDNVRATLVLTRAIINRLKNWVTTQLPTLEYVSSFTVACAYIWSCIAKLRNDELLLFGFPIDCRARVDPPVPSTYFGNCVVPCSAMAKTSLLTEKEGFVTAAKLLGDALHEMVNNKDGIMKSVEDKFDSKSSSVIKVMPTSSVWVTGAPKLKFYDMDFGWGRPKKIETISIDYYGSISMNACKESTEDLEIGVCLSVLEMEAFLDFFNAGLRETIQ